LIPDGQKISFPSSARGFGRHVGLLRLSGGGTNPDGTPKDEQSVNTLPWNKPASWEGGGAIPGVGGAR